MKGIIEFVPLLRILALDSQTCWNFIMKVFAILLVATFVAVRFYWLKQFHLISMVVTFLGLFFRIPSPLNLTHLQSPSVPAEVVLMRELVSMFLLLLVLYLKLLLAPVLVKPPPPKVVLLVKLILAPVLVKPPLPKVALPPKLLLAPVLVQPPLHKVVPPLKLLPAPVLLHITLRLNNF